MRFSAALSVLAVLAANVAAAPAESSAVLKARLLYKRHFGEQSLVKRNNGGSSSSSGITDIDILNFALNLEYLEAQFYHIAAFGTQLSQDLLSGTGTRGYVQNNAGNMVNFTNPLFKQYAVSIAYDEMNHVKDLRAALGSQAVAMPELNLGTAFTGAARAAGIIGANDTFSPYSSEAFFLLGAFLFEDAGVTAYNGAAPLIQDKAVLSAAASILAVEAYHAGAIRANLLAANVATPAVGEAANKAAALEAAVGGGKMLNLTDSSSVAGINLVNANKTTSLAFARTPGEVINIVLLNGMGTVGLEMGGFFPNGLNGKIKSAAGIPKSS